MPERPFSSLYIHVPFCHGKCGYCAFYSKGQFDDSHVEAYLHRLDEEFAIHSRQCTSLNSIFIGGGTPSVLSMYQLSRLLTSVHQYFTLAPNCEWTMECNPESLSTEKIAIASDNGINRFSLGIQNFSPDFRQKLMRNGSLETLEKLVKKIRETPLTKLNFDLIYGIPEQTPKDWKQTLEKACSYHPDHLSAYSLTIEEGTPLVHQSLLLPDDGMFRKFWRISDQVLGKHGLQRYEISNFSRPDSKCRHNNDIWHGATYLGCGPAAVSFNGIDRPANPRSLEAWLAHAPQTHDVLNETGRASEILAFGMRTLEGWNIKQFQSISGFNPFELKKEALLQLKAAHLVSISPSRIHPTRRGLLFNDDILEALI